MSDIREIIGHRIAELRKEKGITQAELSEKSNVGRSHIIRIEQGRYNVRIDILERIVTALGATIDIH